MLRNLSLLVPFLLLVHVTSAAALPPCSGKYHDPCFGVYLWPDGAKYLGEYTNGKKHGQGTFTFPDGTKYAGEYKDGIQNGHGTTFWANGRVTNG